MNKEEYLQNGPKTVKFLKIVIILILSVTTILITILIKQNINLQNNYNNLETEYIEDIKILNTQFEAIL